MTSRKTAADGAARKTIADTTSELAALGSMTTAELAARYAEVFGEPSRSRNAAFLRKKVAWRIQELAEGGLSERAEARIEELADETPAGWAPGDRPKTAVKTAKATAGGGKARDPRIPEPGTVITRTYKGVEHPVTVLDDGGFEHDGTRYRSLSKIAKLITGTNWNGLLFFGLTGRKQKEA